LVKAVAAANGEKAPAKQAKASLGQRQDLAKSLGNAGFWPHQWLMVAMEPVNGSGTITRHVRGMIR
jgi:hypothetical protein